VHTVRNEISRPPAEHLEGFQRVLEQYSPSCLVVDARARDGGIGGLIPVTDTHRIAGPALTVNLSIDDLVDCMPVLALAQPGDVVVLAARDTRTTAMWGALMSTLSQKAGVAGSIVDGAVRDVDEIRALGFPLWYRSTVPRASPSAVHGRTEPVQVNVPIVVGGEVINPGDIVVADVNGVAVVPAADAEAVLEATRAQIDKERIVREKIASGMSLPELLAEFGHL
jgi:regulator of RNase E activity RraA